MAHQVKKNLGVHFAHGGVRFRVWAPFAKRVVIAGTATGDQWVDMESENDGYWVKLVDDARPGQNYKYLIETPEGQMLAKNDPRGLQLTSSDNGASVIADPEFDWQGDGFSPPPRDQQVIYEMHIGTFNRPDSATQGTFYDAIEKLDYLKDLGINMIELMPVTSMSFSMGWGYAPNYIYSVENSYGGRHGLLEFVREAHSRGIGVILDVVYNHFSSGTDLWQFDGWSENGKGGIYFYNDDRCDTPWGGRPDYGRAEVRQFFLDNVAMWLTDFRLDGLRLDSTIYMRNTKGYNDDPEHDIADAWFLMSDINKHAHKIKPGSLMIAEDFSNPALTRKISDGGCQFDAQWQLGFPNAIRTALGLTYGVPAGLADVKRELTLGYNGDVYEKVIFSDSHDTAANGSARLNQVVSPRDPGSLLARERTILASALTLTAPGIPMLLQGQEFMQEGNFNDWQELEWLRADKYAGIVAAHRHLIDLRQNRYDNTAGLAGQNIVIFHEDEANLVLGYHRWSWGGPGDDCVIIVNFGDEQHDIYEITLPINGIWKVRFNSSWKGYSQDFREVPLPEIVTDDNGRAAFTLPTRGVYILSQDK